MARLVIYLPCKHEYLGLGHLCKRLVTVMCTYNSNRGRQAKRKIPEALLLARLANLVRSDSVRGTASKINQ